VQVIAPDAVIVVFLLRCVYFSLVLIKGQRKARKALHHSVQRGIHA